MTTIQQTRPLTDARPSSAAPSQSGGQPGPAVPLAGAASVPRWRRLLATTNDRAALVARIALAAVMFPHGAQHALGWFGGYGFGGTFHWMTGTLGFPAPLAALAIVVELVAPVALLLGVGGRLAAAGLFGLMIGAASTHVANGFFMNWFGGMPAGSEGFEYHLLVLALAGVVMVAGSGAASIDGRLAGPAGEGSFRWRNNAP